MEQFTKALKAVMPQLLTEILAYQPQEKVYGIAFMTTDNFYGMYVAFQTYEQQQTEQAWHSWEWRYSSANLPTKFNQELYQNLVAVVEANQEIDLMSVSPEKWDFAVQLIQAVEEALNAVPLAVFDEAGYSKSGLAFLVTMSDGDYMDEMLAESAQRLNPPKIAKEVLASLN